MSGGGNFTDHHLLIRSNPSASEEPDLESHGSKKKGIKVLLKQLDGGTSGRQLNPLNLDREVDSPFHQISPSHNALGNGAPPEWALLLIGCFLGLATGLCVAAFNRGVHVIHEFAWAGTPSEGAAWLRLQRLADTWYRILLIPIQAAVTLGTGCCLGPEGPSVDIGKSCANGCSKMM